MHEPLITKGRTTFISLINHPWFPTWFQVSRLCCFLQCSWHAWSVMPRGDQHLLVEFFWYKLISKHIFNILYNMLAYADLSKVLLIFYCYCLLLLDTIACYCLLLLDPQYLVANHVQGVFQWRWGKFLRACPTLRSEVYLGKLHKASVKPQAPKKAKALARGHRHLWVWVNILPQPVVDRFNPDGYL